MSEEPAIDSVTENRERKVCAVFRRVEQAGKGCAVLRQFVFVMHAVVEADEVGGAAACNQGGGQHHDQQKIELACAKGVCKFHNG